MLYIISIYFNKYILHVLCTYFNMYFNMIAQSEIKLLLRSALSSFGYNRTDGQTLIQHCRVLSCVMQPTLIELFLNIFMHDSQWDLGGRLMCLAWLNIAEGCQQLQSMRDVFALNFWIFSAWSCMGFNEFWVVFWCM